MSSLYIISQELDNLNNQLIEAGGEVDEETTTQLAILESELQEKGANYGLVVLSNERTVEAIDAEIKRLTDKKKFIENANSRLKHAVEQAMTHFGIVEIKHPLVRLSFRKSESVEITDENKIPASFLKTKTTTSIDKVAIKSAIKEGQEVPGAQMSANQNLQIK